MKDNHYIRQKVVRSVFGELIKRHSTLEVGFGGRVFHGAIIDVEITLNEFLREGKITESERSWLLGEFIGWMYHHIKPYDNVSLLKYN